MSGFCCVGNAGHIRALSHTNRTTPQGYTWVWLKMKEPRTAQPGSGKSPAVDPMVEALQEVLEQHPDLAAGEAWDKFHICDPGQTASFCPWLPFPKGQSFHCFKPPPPTNNHQFQPPSPQPLNQNPPPHLSPTPASPKPKNGKPSPEARASAKRSRK